jgi:hypothetical protein
MLGDALFVAPILDASGIRDVAFPDSAKYYDWFAPMSDAVTGTLSQYDASARDKYPLFVREGAIVPMNVADGRLDVLVYPSVTASAFTLYEDDDTTTAIAQSLATTTATVTLARTVKPTLLRVRVDASGSPAITVDGNATTAAPDLATLTTSPAVGSFVDAAMRSVWVKLDAKASPRTIAISTP